MTTRTISGDNALRDAIGAVRRHWRRRRLVESAPMIAASILAALAIGIGLRAVLSSPDAIVIAVRVAGYSVIALGVAWFLVRPAMQRVSDAQIALYVEEAHPELRQLFVSAVDTLHAAGSDGTSRQLGERLMREAADQLGAIEQGATIERPRVLRAGWRAAGLLAAGALFVALGPVVVRDVARVLFVPWAHASAMPIPMLSVSPGNVSVPRGGALDLHAGVQSLADHGAIVEMRGDSDTTWTVVPMIRDSTSHGYVARLLDIDRNATYHVKAAGLQSADYRITVTDLPTVRQLSLTLRYPAYTGLKPETIDNGGDVVGVVGTTATLRISATLPIRSGSLHFDDGSDVPLTLDAEGALHGEFRVAHDGFYRVDMVAADGTHVPGSVQHSIEALVDHPPTVRIEKPGRDTRVTSVEEVPLSVRASDDFGVRDVQLHFSVNGGADHVIALSDSAGHAGLDFRAVHTLFLEEMSLHVGDLVAYHATVRDGAGNRGSSDIYFMEVRPFDVNYHGADDNGGGGGGGGGGGNNPGKLTERQRELIAGTFNWQRDSAHTADRDRRANATTLAIGQGKLRADVIDRVAQMVSRGVARSDSTFVLVEAELDSAAHAMQPAEDGLGRHVMGDAIPAQEQALQHLQAADAAYRDITVRQQQGGGGGGGGGGASSSPQDLADLFELQTDKLKNQYEAPRTEATTSTQQAIDSTQEKLKDLAARQQQENERQQQLAAEMQQRLGQNSAASGGQGSGGSSGSSAQGQRGQAGQQGQQGQQGSRQGQQLARNASGGATGSSQRELARQAEEQARQLEKLARDQNSPELADAAQRMQQAADAMRQAAAGSTQQGAAAVDRLRDAARNLQGAETATQGQAIDDLARRAGDLGRQQDAIARDVNALGGVPQPDQAKRADNISARKDALSQAITQLGADADRVAGQTRRDQPRAAAAAQTAADEIRNRRLPELINYSKNVMRSGSPEYARQYEAEISESVDSVASRLAAAAGSVGTPRDQQQSLAVARTSDLVRELESLRDRTTPQAASASGEAAADAAGQRDQQSGSSGRGQQQAGSRGTGQPQQGRGQSGQQSGAAGKGQSDQPTGRGEANAASQGRGQGQGRQGPGQSPSPGQGQGQGQGRGQAQSQGQGQVQGRGGQGDQPGGQGRGGVAGGPATGGAMAGPGSVIGDPRQFRGEVAARREAAESLRTDLKRQGVDVSTLDHAIDQLGQLQAATNPGRIDQLQSAIVAELKDFEYNVWRTLNGARAGPGALGSASQIPPQYRGIAEEYYRALARKGSP